MALDLKRDDSPLSWISEVFFLSATGITSDDVAPVYYQLLQEVAAQIRHIDFKKDNKIWL